MRAAFGVVWKIVLAVGVAASVGLLFAFRSFMMPSGSMMPTLQAGDYMAVSTVAYGVSRYALPGRPDLFEGRLFSKDPERGDVVVFALPRDPHSSYVQRVIGLPGDTIQMKAGRLYVNGAMVVREPVNAVRAEGPEGREKDVPTYRETLPGGRSYDVIEIKGDAGFADNTEPLRVPAGKFFAMGDNRDNSADSRVAPDKGGIGFVPLDNLIGRVALVFLSAATTGAVGAPMRIIR